MKTLVILTVLVLAAAAFTGCGRDGDGGRTSTPVPRSTAPPGPDARVTVTDNAFDPADVTVGPGGSVGWTNRGSIPHTITGEGFDSGLLHPGFEYRHAFGPPGVYEYRCAGHPEMTGRVTVR